MDCKKGMEAEGEEEEEEEEIEIDRGRQTVRVNRQTGKDVTCQIDRQTDGVSNG